MSVQIILPKSVEPDMRCLLCGCPFWKDQRGRYERHIVQCVKANEERIHGLRPAVKNPHIFSGRAYDPDLKRWIERHKQEIVEDRKRL